MAGFFSVASCNPTALGNYAIRLSRVNSGELREKLFAMGTKLVTQDRAGQYDKVWVDDCRQFLRTC